VRYSQAAGRIAEFGSLPLRMLPELGHPAPSCADSAIGAVESCLRFRMVNCGCRTARFSPAAEAEIAEALDNGRWVWRK
jgi:hypothetical protein